MLIRPDQRQCDPPLGGGGAQHLQRLLVLAPIMALLAVMGWTASTGIPDSLSSYHGGQYRDLFVGGLIGTAVALLGYWGVTPIEDYTLNVAGFYATIVALVPNDIAAQIGEMATSGQTSPRDVVRVILGGALVTVAAFVFVDYTRSGWSMGWLAKGPGLLRNLTLTSLAVLAAYAVWLAVNVVNPATTFAWVHTPAAVLLFIHLGIAVAAQGWQWMPQAIEPSPARRRLYRAVVVGMLAAPVVVWLLLGLWLKLPQAVLVLEVIEVLLFAVFWISEIGRFWKVPNT